MSGISGYNNPEWYKTTRTRSISIYYQLSTALTLKAALYFSYLY